MSKGEEFFLSRIPQASGLAQPPGLAPKWKAQPPGLAPKYSRVRLYFGARLEEKSPLGVERGFDGCYSHSIVPVGFGVRS